MIGTLTFSTLSSAMRFRSMCSSVPLMGSYCQSTIMALVRSPPLRARSKIVLWPVSECRMRSTCRGSTLMASESLPAPYTTAGIFPPRRTLAGIILGARFPRLRFQCVLFQCRRHKFNSLFSVVIPTGAGA